MTSPGNRALIEALTKLSTKLNLFLIDQGSITMEELDLAESLAEWYTTKGIPLMMERARQKQIATPVEIEGFKASFLWGGKDGKWRWMLEGEDGQARAGEERHLENAFSAAHRAALDMQSPS